MTRTPPPARSAPAPPAPPRRDRRTLVTAVIVVGVLVLGWFSAATRVFVFPTYVEPTASDVLLVLGPPQPWRLEFARELMDEGLAGTLLVSVEGPDEVADCSAERAYPVVCARPDPFTTRGEMMWLRDEMAANGWESATVITMPTHSERARLIAWQCGLADRVEVVWHPLTMSPERWTRDYLYQSAGFVRALLEPAC